MRGLLQIQIQTWLYKLNNKSGLLERVKFSYWDFLNKVGIIALIDEVTGYQEVWGKTALVQFLVKFQLEEKAKWIKTFPDDLFEALFKMKGWTWKISNNGKKPSKRKENPSKRALNQQFCLFPHCASSSF